MDIIIMFIVRFEYTADWHLDWSRDAPRMFSFAGARAGVQTPVVFGGCELLQVQVTVQIFCSTGAHVHHVV